MDEFLPMVYVLSHKDFGPIPTHGLARPHIRFWASRVEKIKIFVYKNTNLKFSHKVMSIYVRNFGTVRFLKFENFLNTFGKNVFFTFLKEVTALSGVNQKSWAFLESSHPMLSPCGILLLHSQVALRRFFQNRFDFSNFYQI